jgi:secondary thiamine-phosphate synthase enzyme
MKCYQKTFSLPPFKRGFHLITRTIESAIPELKDIKAGVAQIFIHHTSASLTINENADPTVRGDFERHFNVMVPESARYYKHTTEGPDDMPAHLKSSLLGSSVNLPVTDGAFNLGIWQGIYLCEHRDNATARELTVTVLGS